MFLVAPQNQAEYDKIQELAAEVDFDYEGFYISGFRSETNSIDWVSDSKKVNYVINWNQGEPSNSQNIENCIGNLAFF